MKIPERLLTTQGKKATGTAHMLGSEGQYLKEYGIEYDGIYATCMVLTSPGDLITISFVLGSGLADHVDLVIDGIRRESSASSGPDKAFSRIFKRACYQEKKNNNKTGGLKSSAMEIQTRKSDKDITWTGDGPASSIGTVEIQLFRPRNATTSATSGDSTGNVFSDGLEDVKRAPTFREFSSWRDLNPHIDHRTTPSSLEIGFTERRQLAKFKAERTIQDWVQPHTLVACLRFRYCSAADLIARGFKNVPSYSSSSAAMQLEPSEKSLNIPPTEPSPSNAERRSAIENQTNDDTDSLFVEDQTQQSLIEYDRIFNFDTDIKIETSPESERALQSNFDKDTAERHLNPQRTEQEVTDFKGVEDPLERDFERGIARIMANSSHKTPPPLCPDLPQTKVSNEQVRVEVPQIQGLHHKENENVKSLLPFTSHRIASQAPKASDIRTYKSGQNQPGANTLKCTQPQLLPDCSGRMQPDSFNNINSSSNAENQTAIHKKPLSVYTPSIWETSTNSKGHLTTASEKRKADQLDSGALDIPEGLRKGLESPELRRPKASELALNAARSRLAAAEKRKLELAQALETIDLSNKTRKLIQEAEEIERKNLELQAKLDMLYKEDSSS